MSARARESFKAVGIRGGAGPGEGAPLPPSQYYTLSEEDRSTFEATLNMTRDNDIKKSSTAREALDKAFKDRPIIKEVIDNLYTMPIGGFPLPLGFFAEGAWLALDFAGYLAETEWEVPDSEGFCKSSSSGGAATGLTSVDFGARSGNTQDYTIDYGSVMRFGPDDGVSTTTPNSDGTVTVTLGGGQTCAVAICVNGFPVVQAGGCALSGSCTTNPGAGIDVGDCYDSLSELISVNQDLGFMPGCGKSETLSGTLPNLGPTDEVSVGFKMPDGSFECGRIPIPDTGIFAAPGGTPSLGDMQPVDNTDFPTTNVPIDDLCKIIGDLQNNPDLQPYLPPPGTPPGTPPPVDLPPVDTPPVQTPDPGVNPFPGQPPTDVPPGTGDPGLPPGDPGLPVPGVIPAGPVVPGIDPVDSGIEDPAAGGCMTLSKDPAGFRDPKQAGGIARQYQPGQPMVVDYGEGSRCKTKITKVKPNKGEDGGPEICVSGQLDNSGKITEKTCYGPGPVEDAIRSVLGDMVAEGGEIIFDSDCARELHRPLCFRAGTPKRVILNTLLDMCGFCVFPMFDCNVIVGYCGPSGVIWTYHEDVDLIKFDLEYDGQEVFDYVEVFRGDFISRAGNVFVRGYSVLYPVGSPASSVNGDQVYPYEVPYGTPDSELASIAITLAAKLRSQALPEIAFGVPLNSQMALRHQLRIQMPSVGFDAYYMVTRLTRDYDRENGHLSTGLARWLRAA